MPFSQNTPVEVASAETSFPPTTGLPETLVLSTAHAGIAPVASVDGSQFRLQNEQSFAFGLVLIVVSIVLTRRILSQRRVDPYGRLE